MPLVSSTPPTFPSQNTPEAPGKNARVAFKNSPWRPAVCCAGALGLGISLAPLLLKPQSVPTGEQTPAEIVLPTESTLIVAPTLPPGALLRGQIRLVADVTGRARASGEVARHLVETGARVQRGDAVVEISSGGVTRAVPRAEFRQNRAEQGQIAAADAQTALAQKIGAAQTRLREAQERVDRSQAQVASARDVVRRLQNGQSVAPSEIPAQFRGSSASGEPLLPAKSRKRRRNNVARGEVSPDQSVNRIAVRQAEAARSAAKESTRDLQNAQQTLTEARGSARQADENLQRATKSVADVEARFGAKKASGADVEAARVAQREAQQAVNNADKVLLASKAEVTKREASAKSSQDYADSMAAQAAKSISKAHLDLPTDQGSNDDKATESEPETAPESSNQRETASAAPQRVTLDQAIQFASAALDESRRASRDAERIHAQIDDYQHQVTNSQSRVEAANQDLISAQQKVLDSVPRPRFTASYAPADGVVTWITRLAREVGVGQAVFGVARGGKIAAHFEDKSGLWRGVKKQVTMAAFVVDNADSNSTQAPDAGPKTEPNAASTTSPVPKPLIPSASYPVQVKFTEIENPESEGAPATLAAEVLSAPGSASNFNAGATVLIPMPLPHQKATLSVPASALVQQGAKTYLAVLSPVQTPAVKVETPVAAQPSPTQSAPDPAAQTTEARQNGATHPEAPGIEPTNQKFRLAWHLVGVGRSDGLRLEITSGLKVGERIVALPEQLEAMGFEPQIAAPTNSSGDNGIATLPSKTVLDTPSGTADATSASGKVSESPVVPQVLVRLAPMLS